MDVSVARRFSSPRAMTQARRNRYADQQKDQRGHLRRGEVPITRGAECTKIFGRLLDRAVNSATAESDKQRQRNHRPLKMPGSSFGCRHPRPKAKRERFV